MAETYHIPEELAHLPPPELVEELDYQAILQPLIQDLVANFRARGLSYNADNIESDAGRIQCEVIAAADLAVRQRINESYRANLLPYAIGGDIDILGSFYDVDRLSGETDKAYKERIILAIRGRSPGGTVPRYQYIARSASVKVASAVIYRDGLTPTIYVSIFSTDNGGQADQSLLDTVDAALQADDKRLVNDTIVVNPAVRRTINVEANVWLLPESSNSVLDTMEASIKSINDDNGRLGFDFTKAWAISKLMVEGVQNVALIGAEDTVIPFNEAFSIGTVTLNNMGREY